MPIEGMNGRIRIKVEIQATLVLLIKLLSHVRLGLNHKIPEFFVFLSFSSLEVIILILRTL